VPERVLAAVDISRQLVLQTRSARMWAVARLLLTTSNVGRTLIVEKGARMPQHFRNPTEPRRTISSSLAALLCAAMMMPLQLAAKEAPTVPEPSQTYSRGDVVTLAAAPDGTRQPDSKVLAVPGDRIQVARTGITVNDEPVKEVSADFLAGLPEDTWAQVVPADHYFVMAEQRAATGVTRFWGLIPVQRISGRR
jgi:signal peptidase I